MFAMRDKDLSKEKNDVPLKVNSPSAVMTASFGDQDRAFERVQETGSSSLLRGTAKVFARWRAASATRKRPGKGDAPQSCSAQNLRLRNISVQYYARFGSLAL